MSEIPIVLKIDGATYFEMPQLDGYLAKHQTRLVEASLNEAISAINEHSPGAIVSGAAPIGREIMDAGLQKGLRGIVKAGTGLDNIDCEYARCQQILVENIPDYVHETVAEYAINLMLSLARKSWPVQQTMRQKGWFDITPASLGTELNGKTIGLVGFGRIARSVARIAHFGFQMSVIAYDPYVSAEEMELCAVQKAEQLEDILPHCDVVSLHTSLNNDTRNLIGEKQLAMMKSSALLINVARGGIIDETALLIALSTQKIGGVALDVYSQEPLDVNTHPIISQMISLNNVLLSPHIAWYTAEAGQRLQASVAQKCQQIIFQE
ncbi:NAD(P)-dependent oxidoreductase [Microscilla marina]|uniref:D-3-phosphoglycerate dehydrogenase n=1 Tax=Microscilla marina ATCC 23134 TaxID=313606 RepID=A1ZGW5_MICM2|nr:NAD(P)-dependent oxidoreductase [Microscilla marina]EAY30234.1 D-3-phosphoglycerate dehydrogenase [Microscilla marina ATCC 23134]